MAPSNSVLDHGTSTSRKISVTIRLRSNDSGLITRLEAAFARDVTAELGYGF